MSVFQTQFTARSLYRNLLRETQKLPYDYLRHFFRLKFRDEFTTNHRQTTTKPRGKRLNRELEKLRAANEGDERSFLHVLDLAYGRKGRLKHELMEPFLSTPKSELAPQMIKGLEKSRPPVYSQAYRALLMNGLSRKTKALSAERINTPAKLPARADPESEDARLLGPFSKRRHLNILWRAYTNESKFVYPPLDVRILHIQRGKGKTGADIPPAFSDSVTELTDAGVTLGGFQGAGVVEQLGCMAGMGGQNHAIPRRERQSRSESENPPPSLHPTRLPTRALRRMHRLLLRTTPLLEYKKDPTARSKGPSYSVTLANEALRGIKTKPFRKMSPVDFAWFNYGKKVEALATKARKSEQKVNSTSK